jgi:hypothetical protein
MKTCKRGHDLNVSMRTKANGSVYCLECGLAYARKRWRATHPDFGTVKPGRKPRETCSLGHALTPQRVSRTGKRVGRHCQTCANTYSRNRVRARLAEKKRLGTWGRVYSNGTRQGGDRQPRNPVRKSPMGKSQRVYFYRPPAVSLELRAEWERVLKSEGLSMYAGTSFKLSYGQDRDCGSPPTR